jgi:hypothetical protein
MKGIWCVERTLRLLLSGLVPLRMNMSTLPGFPPARLEADALMTFEK